MSKKYGLTKHEQDLLTKALKYQEKAEAIHRKFADSLENRFYNSQTISEFAEKIINSCKEVLERALKEEK